MHASQGLRRVRIAGSGCFAPPRVVTNEDLAQRVDTSDEWIQTRTGIRTRHLLAFEGEMGTSEMAAHAAQQALADAACAPEDLDLIIVGTVTPDFRCPSAAALLQHRLGAHRAAGFDVGAACAGSMHALAIAERFIATAGAERALVVGAESLSTITDWSDRNTCVLFGDAAAAVVLEASPPDGPGFIEQRLFLDGSMWEAIRQPAGGSQAPLTPALLEARADRLVMKGREVYRFAVRALPAAAEDLLAAHGYGAADVRWVVSHQANLRMIEAMAERLSIPLDRWIINIDRYGNTSSASTLMTYDEGVRDGRIQPGDLVLLMSIGAGITWAVALYRA